MLRTIFDAAGEFNSAEWVLLSRWGGWTLAGVAALTIAVLALSWHNTRRQRRGRRAWILGLRFTAVAVLLSLFMQPGVRLEHVTRVRNHVAVLIDTSRSMGLPGDDHATRLEAVQSVLAPALKALGDDHQIDLYTVSDRARPVANLDAIQATGDATRLGTALSDLATRTRPEDLAAIIIVSDGADNGALGERLPGAPLPASIAATVARLGAPIHGLFSGPSAPPKDVGIVEVAHDDFAFVRNAVSVEATVAVRGYEALSLPVTLRRGETVLGTKTLRTIAGQTTYRFSFEFVPDQTGKAVFTLEVGQGPGERITSNNRRQFVVRIIRDKLRVLQVVGRPSWDQRFLRKWLKRNPNVDLISFFILRTSASIDTARQHELSLIPFPTRELFEEQLGSFDLIIFQNFTYRGFHMRRYLPKIRDYVKNGGGFVMIGGDQSFSSGGYAGTALAEVLPVELPAEGGDLTRDDRFRGRLTDTGTRHPITRLSVVPEENAELWAALPELTGTNRIASVRGGAQVLVEHPNHDTNGQPTPIVIAGEYGEGRVLAVTTDSTWQWAFQAAAEGGDARHYSRFWGNAIRWMIKDPALEPIRVEADRDRYPLGAEATLVTHVLGADYAPAIDVEVIVEVKLTSDTHEGAVIAAFKGRTDEQGAFAARFSPKSEGAYTVRAAATADGADLSDTDVFVASADPIELRQTAPNQEALKALTEAGGGELRTLKQGLDGLKVKEARVLKVNRRRDVPVWASAWLLLLAILLPSAEWTLRRRWGLL